MTTESYLLTVEYCSQIISLYSLSEHGTVKITPYTGLCNFCSDLASLIDHLLTYQSSAIAEALTSEFIQQISEKIESVYFRMMDLLTKVTEEGLPLIHFNPARGILSKMGTSSPLNPSTVLNTLLSLYAGITHHLRKLKKIPTFNDLDIDRYGFICMMVGKHVFTTSNPCPSPPLENVMRSCFIGIAKRLQQLSFDSKYLFTLGDILFEEADLLTHNPDTHREAIK